MNIDDKYNIMLIEDDFNVAEMYTLYLRKEFNVKIYENGLSALNELESFEPDIILLDMMLPTFSGLDFLKKFKESKLKKVPNILVFSNIKFNKNELTEYKTIINDVLLKSEFTPKQLSEKIKNLIGFNNNKVNIIKQNGETADIMCPHCGKLIKVTLSK